MKKRLKFMKQNLIEAKGIIPFGVHFIPAS